MNLIRRRVKLAKSYWQLKQNILLKQQKKKKQTQMYRIVIKRAKPE